MLSISRSIDAKPWKGSEWKLFTMWSSRVGYGGYCSYHHLPTTYKDNAASIPLFTNNFQVKILSLFFNSSRLHFYLYSFLLSRGHQRPWFLSKQGPANLLYGKGLIRKSHRKLLPNHGHHRDMRIIHKFLKTQEAKRKGSGGKEVCELGRKNGPDLDSEKVMN